jgi:hypothetical protein
MLFPLAATAAWPCLYDLLVETRTFLFTDIEGLTALLGRLGEGVYAQVLADHHALIRSALAAHVGTEIDTQGDAFFAVFSSPRACVAAVLEMRQAIEARAWPAGERLRVRMGVPCGEAEQAPASPPRRYPPSCSTMPAGCSTTPGPRHGSLAGPVPQELWLVRLIRRPGRHGWLMQEITTRLPGR